MTTKTSVPGCRTVYCPHCHLATRADRGRCLHCGKAVSPDNQTQRMLAGLDKSVSQSLNRPSQTGR
jgi:hypothetical protein